MKRKINLLLFATACIFKMNAQVVLYEKFTAPFNPTTNGWDVQNLSSTPGSNTTGWFQGVPAKFNAIAGAPADYFASDINGTDATSTTNTISCWLITPTLNLVNGAFFQVATKGSKLPVQKADRLQIYYSIGAGTNVGTTAGSATNTAGTFTTIIYDGNPNLTAANYPSLWSQITKSLTGIATPTVGRLAFRYYVPNGGAAGVNGNYIGIDEFRYSLPCQRPQHFGDQNSPGPFCAGLPMKLGITNASAVALASYTWFTGATTNTTSVISPTPGVFEVWSVSESATGCQNMDISYVFANPIPTVAFVMNPGNTLCAGSSVTVTASGATDYTYSLSATSSSTANPIVLITPTVTAQTAVQFSLTGATNGCEHKQIVILTVNPLPTLSVSVSKSTICIKTTATLNVSGAASYSWSGAASSTASSVTYTAGATASTQQFTVYGTSPEGCKSLSVLKTLSVSLCAGIDKFGEQNSSLNVYPNPFSNTLNFNEFSGTIEIYSTVGQLMFELKSENIKTIDTSGFPTGIYILKTTSILGEKSSFKLIKN